MRKKGEFSFHSFPGQQGRQWGPGWLHPLTNAASQAVTQQTWTHKSSLDLPYSIRLDSKLESVTKILVSRNLQCNTKRCNRYVFLLLSPSPYSRGCCQTTLTARPDLGEAEPQWRLLNILQPLSSKQVYFFFLHNENPKQKTCSGLLRGKQGCVRKPGWLSIAHPLYSLQTAEQIENN